MRVPQQCTHLCHGAAVGHIDGKGDELRDGAQPTWGSTTRTCSRQATHAWWYKSEALDIDLDENELIHVQPFLVSNRGSAIGLGTNSRSALNPNSGLNPKP